MMHVQLMDTYTGVCTCLCPEEYNLFAQALETHRKMRAWWAVADVFEESANTILKNYIKVRTVQNKTINHRNKTHNEYL